MQLGNEASNDDEQAHQYLLSSSVVTLEHPCIVRNLANGVKSLGGEAQLQNVLPNKNSAEEKKGPDRIAARTEPICAVSLRPNDSLAKKIPSLEVATRNILVRVTLPRWTGRKRKRGSNDPFQTSALIEESRCVTAPSLLRRLQDCREQSLTQPVAIVQSTHRFRNPPDVQMRANDLAIMREIRDHATVSNYDALKNLDVDLTPGVTPVIDFPPPPHFFGNDQPYIYNYQQAAGIVYKFGPDGERLTANVAAAPKREVEAIPYDIEAVPSAPPSGLDIRLENNPILVKVIAAVREVLEGRPIVSKRVLISSLPSYSDHTIGDASQWVGYSFRNGPFRDLIITYGLDPRSDPVYRTYQSLTFQIDPSWVRAPPNPEAEFNVDSNVKEYVFDGLQYRGKGKTWQICDITDDILRDLFDSALPRETCDTVQWGWYTRGLTLKARVIMRDKIRRLYSGEPILSPEIYRPLLDLPDEFDVKLRQLPVLDAELYDPLTCMLAFEIRRMSLSMTDNYRYGQTVGVMPKENTGRRLRTRSVESDPSDDEQEEDDEAQDEGDDEDQDLDQDRNHGVDEAQEKDLEDQDESEDDID